MNTIDDGGEQMNISKYESIYKIRLQTLTLREILIFTSLTKCKNSVDILKVVMDQVFPESFYRSSLDFEGANMISLLTFDSRSMKVLLENEYIDDYMQEGFPLIYTNKF